MTRILALVFLVASVVPAAAQGSGSSDMSVRAVVMVSDEKFLASKTFDAAFSQTAFPMFGGGVQVVEDGYYLELTASRLNKTGQRAFFNNGQAFRLGIPLRVTLTPIELTGGYQYRRWPRFIPYGGGGIGFYKYKETADFAQAGDDVSAQHVGAILEGGVEVRVHRWIGVGADAHYTYVSGILGKGGISQAANEKNLGGIAARFRVIVGR